MLVLNCIFLCTVMIMMLMMSSTFSTMVVLIPLEFVNESMSLSVTSQLKVSTRRYQDICPHSRWRWPRAAWSSETVVRRSATGWRHLPITIVACWSVTHWSSWSLVSSRPSLPLVLRESRHQFAHWSVDTPAFAASDSALHTIPVA